MTRLRGLVDCTVNDNVESYYGTKIKNREVEAPPAI